MKEVDALTKEQCDAVHAMLVKHSPPIHADVWRVGLQLGLRISDLLALRFDAIDYDLRRATLRESKTGKTKTLRINAAALEIIERRRLEHPRDAYIFTSHASRAAGVRPISRVAVGVEFKKAGDILGLHVSTHSMRKSRGKAMYDAGVPLELISKTLNHSSTAETLRYIGITRAQVEQTYDDFEL